MGLAVLVLPIALFALVIHGLEHFMQSRLARRFGWRSVLWTAWLGTPIHEFSHVVMCWIFRHRIEEVRLFDPDVNAGRLGFVRHSFHRGNWFEEFGNVWIGTAPLLGGSLFLIGLSLLFYPSAVTTAIESAMGLTVESPWTLVSQLGTSAGTSLLNIVTLENLVTARFWCYVYLVLCVGCHMAPSWSDYQGAARGALVCCGLAILVTLAIGLSGVSGYQIAVGCLPYLAPLWSVAILAIGVCSIAAAGVFALTTVWRK